MTARRRPPKSQRRPRSGEAASEKESATPADEERRVRYTLDLSREQHRFLRRYAFDAEIDASVVMRTLLALLQNDDTVARKVRSELEG
jgi:hypothetical protein